MLDCIGDWLERRPVLLPGATFCLGTGLGVGLNGMANLPVGLAVVAFVVFTLKLSRKDRVRILGATLVLTVAWGLAVWHGRPQTDAGWQELNGLRVTLRGTVGTDPGTRLGEVERRVRVRFAFDVSEMQMDGSHRRLDSRVTVVWHGSACALPRYGETWRFRGRVRCFQGHGGPVTMFYTGQGSGQRLATGRGVGWLRGCFDFRSRAGRYLSVGLDQFSPEGEVMQALVLGYRDGMTREIRDLFVQSGTLHIFAISGLHVGILASFLVFALRWIRLPRTRWALVIVPLLFVYTCSTGMRASAWRAFVMATVYFAAPLLGRRRDGVSALVAAAIIILLVSPRQLVDIGFIYSFTVVAGIMLLYPHVVAPFGRLWRPNPLLIEPERRMVRFGRAMLKRVTELFALSASAWLASVPLTIHFFGRVSIYAVINNMVAVPMAYLVVLLGVLSLVVGSAAHWVTILINRAAWWLVHFLLNALAALVRLPGASLEVNRSAAWGVLAAYVVTAGMIVGWRWRDKGRKRRAEGVKKLTGADAPDALRRG